MAAKGLKTSAYLELKKLLVDRGENKKTYLKKRYAIQFQVQN